MKKDWSEHAVLLQPLARKLEELLNFREYKEASEIAKQLENEASALRLYCEQYVDDYTNSNP